MSTALQLTNFWQDVAADAARDRIYIPAEDLHFFGVTEADIKALKPDPAAARSAPLRGRAHPRAVRARPPAARQAGQRSRVELALIWLVGMTILDKIEAADYDVFTQRPTIRRRDQAVDHGARRQGMGHPSRSGALRRSGRKLPIRSPLPLCGRGLG